MQQKEVNDQFKDVEEPVWTQKHIEKRGIKIIDAAMVIWDIKKVKDMLPSPSVALF